MHQCPTHGSEAVSEIPGELLILERLAGSENLVIGPGVESKKSPNAFSVHHVFVPRRSTNSASARAPLICSRATVTGSLNLRGPALPGLMNRTPWRRSTRGLCE